MYLCNVFWNPRWHCCSSVTICFYTPFFFSLWHFPHLVIFSLKGRRPVLGPTSGLIRTWSNLHCYFIINDGSIYILFCFGYFNLKVHPKNNELWKKDPKKVGYQKNLSFRGFWINISILQRMVQKGKSLQYLMRKKWAYEAICYSQYSDSGFCCDFLEK